MTRDIATSNWDNAYQKGKYSGEEPIAFVSEIVEVVKDMLPVTAKGFYPGCGNGRNFIPLAKAGLDISGNDISEEAITQLRKIMPKAKVVTGEFLKTPDQKFDYVVSIQLFQHGDVTQVRKFFEKTAELLGTGGLFFLRVNSIHTQIKEKHSVVEHSKTGGFTIRYATGQKTDQLIHFYSAEEIYELTENLFEVIVPLREEFIPRNDGTQWVQWETILKRR